MTSPPLSTTLGNDQTAAEVLRLHVDDNVGLAKRELAIGQALHGSRVLEAIPAGHKVCVSPIAQGDPIRKYGQVIGFASESIEVGRHVHVHNCQVKDFSRDPEIGVAAKPTQFVPAAERATFRGIVRANGVVATRNYVGVVTTVNCSATVARAISAHFAAGRLAEFPNVDGVAAFVHTTGCGMANHGTGFDTLQRTLAGYMKQPNLAAVLVLGLGCEVNQGSLLLESYGLSEGPTTRMMTIQDAGGTRRAIQDAIAWIESVLPLANQVERRDLPASKLKLALQCGGSDGYSGITANPALGAAADLLIRNGGTVILSETPEIYGAEHLLTRRAASPAVGEKLLERIRWWERYTAQTGDVMDNNPSHGNKVGGLTTILEKSLGAVAKGGTTNLEGVYEYAEPIDQPGFVFMDSPGYDPCSATGQVASGANVLCFTTGRGSVFGCKPVPSIKLATNSSVYRRLSEDMDIDCGVILEQGVGVAEMGERIFERILAVASGERTKSEELGFGEEEFVPWQLGAVM
jgi:altronate hydrolase